MYLFPDFILSEIFSYFDENEHIGFRLISKKCDYLLHPYILRSLSICLGKKNWANEAILNKFGRNILDLSFSLDFYGSAKTLEECEKSLIQETCPNVTSIKYSIEDRNGHLDIGGIMDLNVMFPKIKNLSLSGRLVPKDLETLSPLISKLDSLALIFHKDDHQAPFDKRELIAQLKPHHLKRVVYPDHFGYEFLDLAAQELVNASVIESGRFFSIAYGPSYAYDMKKKMFQKILIGEHESDLRVIFAFALENLLVEKKSSEDRSPSERLKSLETLFSLNGNHYSKLESQLPPIQSMTYQSRTF